MKYISAFHVENKKELNDWKKCAFLAGQRNILWSVWEERTKIRFTDFQTGKIAEIIIAWMLGIFQENAGINFEVRMNKKLDEKGKTDFAITRQGMTSKIQMKFENNKEVILPYDVIRIDLAAAKGFEGRKIWKHHDSGALALNKLLTQTGLFDTFEVSDFLDEHPDIEKALNFAWKFMKN